MAELVSTTKQLGRLREDYLHAEIDQRNLDGQTPPEDCTGYVCCGERSRTGLERHNKEIHPCYLHRGTKLHDAPEDADGANHLSAGIDKRCKVKTKVFLRTSFSNFQTMKRAVDSEL